MEVLPHLVGEYHMSEVTEKVVKRGIGTAIREALLTGATNDAALEKARAEFPRSSTTKATVSWYRNDMRAKGEKVPTAREAAQAAAPAPVPASEPAATA
jgi:hypothetical protein